MVRKLLLLVVAAVVAAAPAVRAEYYFSLEVPGGHTLYFNYVSGGVQVSFPSNNSYAPYTGYTMPVGDIVIPDTITHAGQKYAVKSIGSNAFMGCTGLVSVSIPSTVTVIGKSAFSGCSGLTTLHVPSSVSTIGNDAFFRVNNVAYSGSATGRPWGAKNLNGYVSDGFVFASSARDTVTGYVGRDSVAVIPPYAKAVGDYAMYEIRRVKAVEIPASVTHIGVYAFAFCEGLTEVVIPDSVRRVGERAFHYCANLRDVVLGTSVDTLGENAFSYCTSLTEFTVSRSVRLIDRYAFYYCTRLREVTLGKSVRNIGVNAFGQCALLDTINVLSFRPPTLDELSFGNNTAHKTVFVPCGQTDYYLGEWEGDYSFVEVGSWLDVAVRSANPGCGTAMVATTHGFTVTCDSMAVIEAIAAEGCHFSHWSDGTNINPNLMFVFSDTTFTAYFEPDSDVAVTAPDIDDNSFSISVLDGRIAVADRGGRAGGATAVRVFDVMGRPMASLVLKGGSEVSTGPLPAGVYVVAVGHCPAQKAVVVRQ